jgi:hypothetical protein
MAGINETMVREFFEVHGFLVRQPRKFISQTTSGEEQIDLLVYNPRVQSSPGSLPFVLTSKDLERVHRALVVVRGWHTDSFSPGFMSHAPDLLRFEDPSVIESAVRAFGGQEDLSLTRILVLPALPQEAETRSRSIALLESKGVQAVIPFRTILTDLVDEVQVNRNYVKSDLLQVLRILKNYDFFKELQMDLFGSGGRKKRRSGQARSPAAGAEVGPTAPQEPPKELGS